MIVTVTHRQPRARQILAAILPALASVLLPQATMATGVPRHTTTEAVAKSATAHVAPFKMSFTAQTILGAPSETHLTRIVILQATPGDRVAVECLHCRGGGEWSTRARAKETAFSVSHLILTERSRLVVDVTKDGLIGRYKEYTLDPRRHSHHLIRAGCLAINLYLRISCSASGKVDLPLGPGAVFPAIAASCPAAPCLVIGRTTGFQVSLAGQIPVSMVGLSGSIDAWQIALSAPDPDQISYFDATEGGTAEAGIAILRSQPGSGHAYVPIAHSSLVSLQPYFGTTAHFALVPALPVERGDVVALTSPTWAPALATGMEANATWRASRPSSQCSNASEQTAATQLGVPDEFGCLYDTAALTYSATLSPGV